MIKNWEGVNTMEKVSIVWKGPFVLTARLNEETLLWEVKEAEDCYGIYVLCWLKDDEYHPHYIGMTEQAFAERIKQHIKGFASGNYYIYNVEALDRLEKEYDYNPNTDGLSEFIKDYVSYSHTLNEYFSKLKVFLAPLELNKDELLAVEATLSARAKESLRNDKFLDNPYRENLVDLKLIKQSTGEVKPKGL